MAPILVISASPSEQSRTAALADLLVTRLSAIGVSASHLRLRDLPAEPLLAADVTAQPIADAIAAVDRAEGVIFITPTYKAAYSGLLKVFLDLLDQFALRNKIVLPLATGGSLAHVLSIDYALRPVLHSLKARHIVQGHFVIDKSFVHDGNGYTPVGSDLEPVNSVMEEFLQSVESFRTPQLQTA